MKPLNCTEQAIAEQICVLMNGNINFATFHNVPVSIQMVSTLLIINQILQVWYQNEEDIHMLPMIPFNWPNMKHFWKNLTIRSVQELFFLLSVSYLLRSTLKCHYNKI